MSTRPRPTASPSRATSVEAGHQLPSAQRGARVPSEPSLSASLILIAPTGKPTSDGYNYKVLLLQRNKTSSTYLNAHVFPGGNVDPSDWDPRWKDLLGEGRGGEEMSALEVCAVRECFEECGLLLARRGAEAVDVERWLGGAEKKAEWREKVHNSGAEFWSLFEALRRGALGQAIVPATSLLQHRAKWITPKMMLRRFATSFFVALLPRTSSSLPGDLSSTPTSLPLATPDQSETISATWLSPQQAVTSALARVEPGLSSRPLILFPPQFYLLAELAQHKDYHTLLEESAEGRPALIKEREVHPLEPRLRRVLDDSGQPRSAMTLPGDESYDDPPEPAARGRRHRTYIVAEEPEKGKPLRMVVMGLHRRGVDGLMGVGWGDMVVGDCGVEEGRAGAAKL